MASMYNDCALFPISCAFPCTTVPTKSALYMQQCAELLHDTPHRAVNCNLGLGTEEQEEGREREEGGNGNLSVLD